MPRRPDISYEDHMYADTPRIRAFIARAVKINAQLPVLEKDFTRLWRGNRPDEVGSNPSFTNSLVGIALPFMEIYGGDLSYVDVPTAEVKQYLDLIAVAKNAEFMLPPHLACNARIVDPSIARAEAEAGRPSGNIIQSYSGIHPAV